MTLQRQLSMVVCIFICLRICICICLRLCIGICICDWYVPGCRSVCAGRWNSNVNGKQRRREPESQPWAALWLLVGRSWSNTLRSAGTTTQVQVHVQPATRWRERAAGGKGLRGGSQNTCGGTTTTTTRSSTSTSLGCGKSFKVDEPSSGPSLKRSRLHYSWGDQIDWEEGTGYS